MVARRVAWRVARLREQPGDLVDGPEQASRGYHPSRYSNNCN